MPEESEPEANAEAEYAEVDLNTHDLQLRVSQWCDAAFERFGQGERFTFMMTVQVNPPPVPNQPPQFFPAVIFWLPGAMINTTLSGAFTITNPHGVTREEIYETVRSVCEQMLNARTNDLKQAANGHGDGPPLRLTP